MLLIDMYAVALEMCSSLESVEGSIVRSPAGMAVVDYVLDSTKIVLAMFGVR